MSHNTESTENELDLSSLEDLKRGGQILPIETSSHLLNSSFERYILNTNGISNITRFSLPQSPYDFDKVSSSSTLPPRKLYSRGLFNHLVHNPFRSDGILFIDEDYTLQYGTISKDEQSPPHFKPLYKLNNSSVTPIDCREYPSALFASQYDLITSNGSNQLVWLRLSQAYNVSLASNIPLNTSSPLTLLAGHQSSRDHLEVIVMTSEEKAPESSETDSPSSLSNTLPKNQSKEVFKIFLLALSLDKHGSCTCDKLLSLDGETPPYSAHLDHHGASFIVSSEKGYSIVDSSETRPIDQKKAVKDVEKNYISKYQWSQTSDELTITLTLSAPIPSSQLVCNITPSRVTIALKTSHLVPQVLLNKAFFDTIQSSESTWAMESNTVITFHISKDKIHGSFSGSRWPQLFKEADDDGVIESVDPSEAVGMLKQLDKFTSDSVDDIGSSILQNQVGEAPEPEDYENAQATILRYSYDGSVKTYDTVGYEWISHSYNTVLLKRDVDGLVFNTSFKHLATFPALAYIAASKRMKRFILYPDHHTDHLYNFAALIESRRFVYIYRPLSGGSEGEQNLVDLTNEQEILGARILHGHQLCLITSKELIIISLRM